jgi:hypothetical protein
MNNDTNEIILKDYVQSDAVKNRIHSNVDWYLIKWSGAIERYGDLEVSNPELKKIETIRSWNWSAFLFTYYWGIWRGVHRSWLLLSIISVLYFVSIFLTDAPIVKFIGYGTFGISSVYGWYGNSWYLRTLINKRNDVDAAVAPSKIRLLVSLIPMVMIIFIGIYFDDNNVKPNENKTSISYPDGNTNLKQVGDNEDLTYYAASLKKNGNIISVNILVNPTNEKGYPTGTSIKYPYQINCDKKLSRTVGNVVTYSEKFGKGGIMSSEKYNANWSALDNDSSDPELFEEFCSH